MNAGGVAKLDVHFTRGPDGKLIYRGITPRGYNPQQPRHPAGSSEGGQWADDGVSDFVPEESYPGEYYDPNAFGAEDVVEASVFEIGIGEEAAKILEREGLTGDDIAHLVGAMPGARVDIGSISDGGIYVNTSHPEYDSTRYIYLERKHISNEYLRVKKRGTGLGTEVLAQQVAEASARGFTEIHTYAAGFGGGGSEQNGYYTWARLGYDAEVFDNSFGPKIEDYADEHNLASLSDFMRDPTHRAWWRSNGKGFDGVFDLREGSLSRRVLAAYVEEKRKRAAGGAPGTERGGRGPARQHLGQHRRLERGYNPQQPRDPAGTPTGGRWSQARSWSMLSAEVAASVLKRKLTDVEKYALVSYTGGSSNQINEYLRTGKFTRTDGWDGSAEDIEGEVATIDQVFEKADPLTKDIIVHRYIHSADTLPSEGGLFRDGGYVSTSFTEEGHAAVKNEFGSDARISVQIRVPKGTPAVPMVNGLGLAAYRNQHELLLPRGLTFKVLKKAKLAVLLEAVNDDE